MLYNEVKLGETIALQMRKFTPLPSNHVVSAVGYQIDNGKNNLVFTEDTTVCDDLCVKVNKIKNLKYLIIETAYSNSDLAMAKLCKHLCPSLLMSELANLMMYYTQQTVEVYITHLKPGEGESIMQEIAESHTAFAIQSLKQQQEFHL